MPSLSLPIFAPFGLAVAALRRSTLNAVAWPGRRDEIGSVAERSALMSPRVIFLTRSRVGYLLARPQALRCAVQIFGERE